MGKRTEADVEEVSRRIFESLDQTLSSRQLNDLIREAEGQREPYRQPSQGYYPGNVTLFLMYLAQERTYEACQLIAEYRMDLDELEEYIQGIYIPRALRDRGIRKEEGLIGQLYGQMRTSARSYDDYYEIFAQFPSGEYAQLLILYAREERRWTDTVVLSNYMRQTVEQKHKRLVGRAYYGRQYQLKPEIVMLSYYTDRLQDLSKTEDYQEIRRCVNEAKREYDYGKEIIFWHSPEWLPRFWINMMHCLNILERYDKTIWLAGTIEMSMTDSDYYLYLAEAYYASNQMEEAEKNGRRSVALDTNQDNLLLLSQVMFTQRKYKTAEKLLLQSIGMRSVEAEGLHRSEFQKKLESPYTLLFLCYVYEEDFAKAKAFYEEIRAKLAGSDMAMISGCLLQVNEKAAGKMDEIGRKQKELQKQLKEASKENREQRLLMKKWTAILAECQIADGSQEVSTEYWEQQLAERMEQSIRKISELVKKSNESGYKAEEERIREAFPKLPAEAEKFLTSAEQMFQVFRDNEVIDFAPVMVEYCKVIEVLIWSYLDRTGEYEDEIANNQYKHKTLGAAQFAIQQAGEKKSLFGFLESLKMVTRFRNKSAHKEVLKREPDLREVRKLIWEGRLLQKLCS